MMKKVIVTGATGFIGTWLVKYLLEAGMDVTVIVRNKKKLADSIKDSVTVHEYMYDEYEKIEMAFDEYDVFYHMAWEGVSTENKNVLNVQMKNIEMAVSALQLANRIGCKKFVMAGTVAEYADCDGFIQPERKQTPGDLYGAVKTSAYYILHVLAQQLGIGFIWAILPSTYGEGRADNNIITYTICKLLKGDKPLYGDLDQLWDFLYVGEVVKALALIGEHGIPGKTYGVGSGSCRPIKDYICAIRDMINPDLELGIGELPQNGQRTNSSCVEIYDLVKDTDFKVNTSFEQGIRKTIEYYMKNS
jgi:nucleoside-diphosphate-sugar epimerase